MDWRAKREIESTETRDEGNNKWTIIIVVVVVVVVAAVVVVVVVRDGGLTRKLIADTHGDCGRVGAMQISQRPGSNRTTAGEHTLLLWME